MVTIVGYNLRASKEGDKKQYITLELEGDVEMVQSQNTGRHYATVRRCVVFSTFDPISAERMVGKQMAGTIERVPSEPYEFTIEATGEIIKLGYRWDYVPENTMRMHAIKPKAITQPEPNAELVVTSQAQAEKAPKEKKAA